jgi:hypothetical protein
MQKRSRQFSTSPEQQQQELLKKKPEVNDPDYALKLEAYGKLSSLVSRKNEAIQAQRDPVDLTKRFLWARNSTLPISPCKKPPTIRNGAELQD